MDKKRVWGWLWFWVNALPDGVLPYVGCISEMLGC